MTKIGVHQTHCCSIHGCKYGDDDCPVYLKEIKQAYPCESCELDKIYVVTALFKDGGKAICGVFTNLELAKETADNVKLDNPKNIDLQTGRPQPELVSRILFADVSEYIDSEQIENPIMDRTVYLLSAQSGEKKVLVDNYPNIR